MNKRRLIILMIISLLIVPVLIAQTPLQTALADLQEDLMYYFPIMVKDEIIMSPPATTEGNNLSYPVIWAEGIAKTLRGLEGAAPLLQGEVWYQWGTNGSDPDIVPASCLKEKDEPHGMHLCDDGNPGTFNDGMVAGLPEANTPMPLVQAFIQKDLNNVWQAFNGTPEEAGVAESDGRIQIDLIDWGDNLESVDWNLNSMVRTEVVLFKIRPVTVTRWLEYEMRHTSGWGKDEAHGLASTLDSPQAVMGSGEQATVYSHCGRLTIQRLLVPKGDEQLANLVWVPEQGWTGEGIVNAPLFNMAVHQAGDGPGYYNAEINVKGRVIYGYTWSLRDMNEGEGAYRITFSFDATCGSVPLNAYFGEFTELIMPVEEGEVLPEAEPTGGGTPVLDIVNNLTYIDINITP